MKIAYYILLLTLTSSSAFASDDPINDFIRTRKTWDSGYYATDRVLRLDLDLQGNGQTETLLTLNRDRDGKAGNDWKVYKKTSNGYQQIGEMTFSPTRFYLGPIDELGKYGLVAFYPGGAGNGVFWSYVYDGTVIHEQEIGKVTGKLDASGNRIQSEAEKKYLHDKVTKGNGIVTEIDATELKSKYGVKIEEKSYNEALHNGFNGSSSQ